MTFTATQIRLPANASVRPGQYARFSALGHFLRAEDHLTNGLGTIYRAEQDGKFSRVFF